MLKVYGYSLKQEKLSLYNFAKIDKIVSKSFIGDIRDYNKLNRSIKNSSPDFLIHMAAQPLVRYSHTIFQNILMKLMHWVH